MYKTCEECPNHEYTGRLREHRCLSTLVNGTFVDISDIGVIPDFCPTVLNETPVVETPVVETPVVETPVVETPVVETPVVETPVVEDNSNV